MTLTAKFNTSEEIVTTDQFQLLKLKTNLFSPLDSRWIKCVTILRTNLRLPLLDCPQLCFANLSLGWFLSQEFDPKSSFTILRLPLPDWANPQFPNPLARLNSMKRRLVQKPPNPIDLGGQNPNGFIQEKTHKSLNPNKNPIFNSDVINTGSAPWSTKIVMCSCWWMMRGWRWRAFVSIFHFFLLPTKWET